MINDITLENYRNLAKVKTDFNKDFNLITGGNGFGKSNFLESIYFAIFGESFRPISSNNEIIGDNGGFSKVTIDFELDRLNQIISKSGRELRLNGKRVFSSKLPQRFPITLFAPQSVDLVAREPNIRRNDLDHFLSIVNRDYKSNISLNRSIFKNRNSVIKMIRDKRSSEKDLGFWTDKLIETSFLIYKERENFFSKIQDEIELTLNFLAEPLRNTAFKKIKAIYIPSLEGTTLNNFKDVYKKKYMDNFEKEIIVGKTLYGIHKDDYRLELNDKNLRFLGSRGQQRIGVLLFKIAQSFFVHKLYGSFPALLLDDIMSELDSENRLRIFLILSKIDTQKIITTADIGEIPGELEKIAKVLSIFS